MAGHSGYELVRQNDVRLGGFPAYESHFAIETKEKGQMIQHGDSTLFLFARINEDGPSMGLSFRHYRFGRGAVRDPRAIRLEGSIVKPGDDNDCDEKEHAESKSSN
jgi:hypothetical protein